MCFEYTFPFHFLSIKTEWVLSGCQGELQWIAGAVCALPSSPGLQMNKPSCFLGWVKVTDMDPATAFPALGQGKNG